MTQQMNWDGDISVLCFVQKKKKDQPEGTRSNIIRGIIRYLERNRSNSFCGLPPTRCADHWYASQRFCFFLFLPTRLWADIN